MQVSVVIPAFNAEDCLARAIHSVLRQSVPAFEILVIDDGSSDATARVAEGFGAAIRLVRQTHAGAASARNRGIVESRGDLIAFLDADDEWLPHKLERQLPLHRENGLVLSFSRSHEYSPDGHCLGDTFGDWRPVRGSDVWRALLETNFIATPTVLARREDLMAEGGFDPRLPVGEDQDMWIRLALHGPINFVEESLVKVHVREGSLSGRCFQDQLDHTWPMIQRHMQRLAPRLSDRQARAIRAARLGRMGRTAYALGEWGAGLRLLAVAVWRGDRLWHNFRHLAAGSPPARWMKKRLDC